MHVDREWMMTMAHPVGTTTSVAALAALVALKLRAKVIADVERLRAPAVVPGPLGLTSRRARSRLEGTLIRTVVGDEQDLGNRRGRPADVLPAVHDGRASWFGCGS